MSKGNLPDSLSQAMLVGIMLVGRLGVVVMYTVTGIGSVEPTHGARLFQGKVGSRQVIIQSRFVKGGCSGNRV